jgi:antitoxin component YwqK of YwqJK toxin-antitoxin module
VLTFNGTRFNTVINELVWHPNGILAHEYNYNDDGKPHGIWCEWDDTGTPTTKIRYVDGEKSE